MNLRKKASVLLTLAVAFMMLVVPLSTSLGGGVQEFSKNNLSDNTEDIGTISSHEFIYKKDEAGSSSNPYTFKFTQDSTVVQMIPYEWNTLKKIVEDSGNVDSNFTVFNGWNVTYEVNGNTYGIYVTSSDDGTKLNYTYTAEKTSDNQNIASTKTLARIMPGDGVILGDTAGYDSSKKVLTLPTGAKDVTFTAVWDAPQIVGGGSTETLQNVYNKLSSTSYNPITGDGSIFTNIIYADKEYAVAGTGYNSNSKSATILGFNSNIKFIVNPSNTNISGETYFENITLDNGNNNEMRSNNSRLILGESVSTTTPTDGWYSKINNGNATTGFRIYNSPNCIILGGNYTIVSGTQTNDDSYISVGSQYAYSNGPNIFMLYGSNKFNNANTTSNTNIIINSGNVLELMGGAQNGSTASSTIEVAGGYVSYLTGGPRSGSYTVGTGSGTTAVKINVSGGAVDYLFSGAKDGNSRSDTTQAPVKGDVKIKVSGGKIYSLFGGGYDFWNKTVGNGVIGDIDILITGGQIGKDLTDPSWESIGSSIGNKPSNYYEISPGVYGGGYRGSVQGNVTIKIGGNISTDAPSIYGNVYGGGSGGPDLSLRVNNDGGSNKGTPHNDTTGKSHIIGSTNVVIGNATIDGNVYGGGMGVAKSSYVKITNVNNGTLAIFTDLDAENREVAKVTGTTTVKIQNDAKILGNVYGGGKGVSRSVFIGPDASNPSKAVSQLYGYSEDEKGEIKYEWQYCKNNVLDFTTCVSNGSNSDSYTNSTYDSGYLRLKVTLNDETVYSNALSITNSTLSLDASFNEDIWKSWNNDLDSIAKVEGNTSVYIFNGEINGNVYGGGSIAVVEGNTLVSMSGGVVGERNGGRVFGGGEGTASTETNWAGLVTVSTKIEISDGNIKGNVYGGGNFGVVGTANINSASTNINISGNTTYIAGSVYGGGKGDENDNLPKDIGEGKFGNGVTKGNIYGNTNVTISGGKIGYYTRSLAETEPGWLDSEDSGSVFGGGKLGLVTGKTDVKVSGTAEIYRNVFGGGKGLSKSVFIELSDTKITSKLYNMIDSSHESEAANLGLNFGVVKSYKWEVSDDAAFLNPNQIADTDPDKTSILASEADGYKYVRLTLTVSNSTTGEEEIVSNIYDMQLNTNNLSFNEWESNNRYMVQFGIVEGSTNVTVNGGTVYTNVYGGGSYAAVGVITAERITPYVDDEITYDFRHMISKGTTNVTISGGTIGSETVPSSDGSVGNVFGGGMGEPNLVTTGSVGEKTEVFISGGTVTGNVYGGGENGFVGKSAVDISDHTSKIIIGNFEGGVNTYSYDIKIVKPDGDPIGSTNVTISGGTIGQKITVSNSDGTTSTSSSGGNVFGAGKGASATVVKSSTVKISSDSSTVTINGNVYGGGELGLVGALLELNMSGSAGEQEFEFTVGSTNVIISGNTEIKGNVFGGGKGEDETETTDTSLNAIILGSVTGSTNVEISGNVTIGTIGDSILEDAGNVYGGGELGIVGIYHDNGRIRTYEGGSSTLIIKGGTIYSVVYGGGKGTVNNVLSGAVGNATTIVSGSTTINGNVYGGGAYSIVGGTSVTIDKASTAPIDSEKRLDPRITAAKNNGRVDVIILGGNVIPISDMGSEGDPALTSSVGNVFGGGYGPKATVAGSTYVFIGKPTDNNTLNDLIIDIDQSNITIFGNIFGGGDMGSIGFDANTSQKDVSDFGKDYNTLSVSSNIFIETSNPKIMIGGIPENNTVGNIYAGGRGGDLIHMISDDPEKYETLKGYAIVHGNSNLSIKCSGSGTISVTGSIYGAGQGNPKVTNSGEIGVILYAAVTGNTSISISNADVNSIYGGGQLSILGYYHDNDTSPLLTGLSTSSGTGNYRHYYGTDTKIIINKSRVLGSVYGGGYGTTANAISGAVGESTVIIGGGSEVSGSVYGGGNYAAVSDQLVVNKNSVDNNGKINPTIIASNNISKAIVVILNAEISENVYGGGYGPRAVVAGSTYVFIGVSGNESYPSDLIRNMDSKYRADVKGSIYGGGNMGSVGFIMELEGSENKDSFPTGYQPISVSSNVILSLNGDADNRIIVGDDVYGGGRGGDLYIPYEGNPTDIKPDNWDMNPGRVLYGYAVVHGQSNVSITGSYAPSREGQSINITNNVFGGGEGMESSDGQSLDIIVYAAVTDTSSVNISNAHITGNIYGGGNLGVVGYFIDSEDASSKILREFTGKDSNVTINASFIEGTVFGGGRGTITNILSGAVGNTKVVIKGEETSREISPASTVTGSVYGGGAYALIGSMGITIDVIDNVKSSPVVTSCRNDSKTSVIILNSTIGSETKSGSYGSGNVFGGGYGPRAVIAGSTEVCIGSNATLASSVTINGSVYGGGNMGSIGVIPGVFSFEKIDDYSQVNSKLEAYNNNIKDDNTGNKRITADVKVVINNESDTIHIKGSVYGGGQGGDLTTGPNGEEINLKGYAVVYGTTDVEIHGISSDSKSKLVIDGNVYGGGLGSNTGVQSIQYAEIYDSANVNITYAEIKGNIYGGGDLGIIGHFTDSTARDVEILSDSKHVWVIERDFCGDAIYFNENDKPELDYNDDNGYKGRASTTVTITDSSVSGSVYGGGKGRGDNGNILSGAVGRETNVTVNSGTIGGNVYGGGEFGIVGSTTTQLIMITPGNENPFDGINIDTTTAASVIVNIPHLNLNSSGIIEKNLDIQNDIYSRVNIYGGTISGSIYGAGKGENLNPLHVWTEKGINKADYQSVQGTTAYNKLSVIGRTEVNISNGIINKHVYGGSENGDVGGFSILKSLMQYLHDTNQNIDLKVIANLDDTTRDNNTYEVNKESKNILNYQFSASFVNIVGGTIHGNVFGGGYFGAIYGNTHVHIGWNSVMPYDDNSNGECHYYNNYGDDNYAGKGRPFDITEGSEKTKADYVHDLFINGTVFAGGDRGDPSATTINYDYISVYGSSHIFVNGTGYATGTNISGETKAMYIQGSLFGSGNSCTTFYSDKDMTRFITIRNYNAINDQNQFIIYSIQRATNVTLVNSSLRLPGRSDGSNVNKTALYSLNHVISLTLQGGSEIILDSVVQDLRSIYSKDGTGADTAQNNALNTIKLNNGITLIIKTEKGLGSVTSPNPALSDEPELWPDGEFGKVTGYFFLDLSDTSYYTAYVYGSLESQGGFTYGNSFGSLSGTKVPHEDFEKDSEGYRAWHPIGGGHLSASSTIVADTDNKSGSEYVNYGKIVLPMTEAGAKFKLIGYDIYPAQAASLNDDKASLRLIGENVSFGNSDVNRFFKLKAVLGNGFTSDNLGESAIWLTSDKGDSTIPGREFIATGGATLPEIDLELHSAGVTQTTTAGYVVLLIQESIPVLDENGDQLIDDKGEKIYTPGNEISAIVNIETQAAGFGATKDNKNYENDMNLYATKEGEYSWNMSISNINDDKYRFELTNVSIDGNFNLVDDVGNVNSKDRYMIRMNHSLNNDNSTGWDGFSFEEFALNAGNQNKFLGETDGRFNTSFQFIINNLKDSSGYAIGTVTLTISYYNLSKSAKASEEPVLADNTTPDGTIQIEIYVGELKPWYNVKFVPAPGEPDAGVGAVATQQITHGDVADKPTPDPSRQDNKYSFGGWYRTYTDASEQKYSNPYSFDDSDPSAVITADTTLYGKWVSSVTFNYNYDNCPNPVTVPLSDKEGTVGSNMPQNPVRAGYTFDEWSTSETGTADFTGDTRVSQNTTVYAKWTSNDYTVVFNANKPTDYGGDITVPIDGNTYKVGNTINLKNKSPNPNIFELNGKQYKFKGWSIASQGAVTGSTESIELTDEIIKYANDSNQITLYAVWVESTLHTVTLTTNHPAAGKYVSFEYYTENATEKPVWTKVTNGAFTVADGTNVNIRFIKEIPNSNNTYPGYSFGSWSVTGSNANNTSLETLSFTVAADSGVTLNLTASEITVTLELNGGTLASSTSPITVIFGEKYSTLPASNPTKLGYTFKGWYTAQSNGSEVTSSTEVTNPQSHTLYAIWDPVTYNIVLHNNITGSTVAPVYVPFSKYEQDMSVKLPANDFFTYAGHIFKGWSSSSSTSNSVEYSDNGSVTITDEMIKKADYAGNNIALELYAVWATSNLTISFDNAAIFDGYDWENRIGVKDKNITISASQGNSSFELYDTDTIELTNKDGSPISSDGMVHAGTYKLTLTCERGEGDNKETYQGEEDFIIHPFTGGLEISFTTNEYTYNGLQPNILNYITVYIDNDGIDGFKNGVDYKLSQSEINQFTKSYAKKGESESPTIPTDAGNYTLTLTATSGASDFYSSNYPQAAKGSEKFSITPYTGGIFIEVKDNMIYDGSNAIQDPVLSVYLGTDNSGFEIKDWKSLFDISYQKEDGTDLGSIQPTDAGKYKVILTAKDNSTNYYDSGASKGATGTADYEIEKLSITIKPDENQFKLYGEPTPDLTYKFYDTNGNIFEPSDYGDAIDITLKYLGNDYDENSASFDNAGSYNYLDESESWNKSYSNYHIIFDDKDKSGNDIKFTINKLPIVILPVDGQHREYTFINHTSNIKIYVGDNETSIGNKIAYYVYSLEDYTALLSGTQKNPIFSTLSNDQGKYCSISGDLSSTFLNHGSVVNSYSDITLGTIGKDQQNYSIQLYSDVTQTPVVSSMAVLSGSVTDPQLIITKSDISITVSDNTGFVYSGEELDSTKWTVSILDGSRESIPETLRPIITYKYQTSDKYNSNNDTWTPGLPTNAGTYYVKAVTGGNDAYNGSESNVVQVTIDKVKLTISPKDPYTSASENKSYIEKEYDGSSNVAPLILDTHYTVTSSNVSDLSKFNFNNVLNLDSSLYASSNVQYSNNIVAENNITAKFLINSNYADNFEFENENAATITLNGKITPKAIAEDMIKSISISEKYHGQTVISPEYVTATVIDTNISNTPLKKDTDYTISVKNLNASDLSNVTVDIKINGIGNYKNSVQNTEKVSLQTYTISGTVTDSNNNPLSGVSIILKSEEESIGNVSISANGTYIISNVPYGTIGTITAEKLGYKESTIDLTQSDYPVDANDGFTFVKDIGLTADTYTISYNNNSGSGTIENGTATYDSNFTLSDGKGFNRTGYAIKSWNTQADGKGASYNLSQAFEPWKLTTDLTLYAVWILDSTNPDQTHTVTFDSKGGSNIPEQSVEHNGLVEKPTPDPIKSGCKFAGWYKDAALTDPWDFDKDVVTADVTLYAKWEPKDSPTPTIYKVEYNANGGEGEVPKAELHFAGEFVTVKSADLRKNGYTFKGWCDSVTQTTYQPDERFRMPSRNVCLTAIWESDPISGKEVSVTFIVDNEIYGISSTHIHTALNGAMQPDPVKEGFDFLGWYTKEGEVFTANTIVNDDMTVYAKFELNEDYVLVTYIIDSEVYMTLACKKTKIIEPNVSAGIGKDLNGWYTDKELKNKFDFNTIINEDSLTLYAEWKNNSNFMILFIFALFAGFMAAVIASTKRISFYENKDDEEKYASVIIIGKGTLKDRLPSHSSSNFEGWYSESGELITEDTEITQSMKVYAHWKH